MAVAAAVAVTEGLHRAGDAVNDKTIGEFRQMGTAHGAMVAPQPTPAHPLGFDLLSRCLDRRRGLQPPPQAPGPGQPSQRPCQGKGTRHPLKGFAVGVGEACQCSRSRHAVRVRDIKGIVDAIQQCKITRIRIGHPVQRGQSMEAIVEFALDHRCAKNTRIHAINLDAREEPARIIDDIDHVGRGCVGNRWQQRTETWKTRI